MRHRSLLIACLVLVFAASGSAQTPGTAADPISGTWKGDLGLSETSRNPFTMELKFDGKGAVSGTVLGPGTFQIKTGSFDAQTGALKLEVGTVNFVFMGTAVSGTATGQVMGNKETGTFRMTKTAADAAEKPAGADPAVFKMGFGEVAGWVGKAADLVPAEKYAYRPVDTVRTFGQLVAHIADAHNYYCARGAGKNVQWSDAVEKGRLDKATVVAKLKQSIEACDGVYAASAAPPLMANIAHTNLLYGNIVTYMRMLGLAPPSSQTP